MGKSLTIILTFISILLQTNARADYALMCDDPEYHQYIKDRFAQLEVKNRRLLASTLRDYERSLANSDNPYEVIGDLSRHLKYSAQFDPIDVVNAKIRRIFDHTDELSKEEHIAGLVLDSFSSETHSVGIARAWIAYRQGEYEKAFEELLLSIELSGSAVLSSFGPDFSLIRQMYKDGYVDPVLAYINKTEQFWTGRRPDKLRDVWRKMVILECKIQFDSVDTIKAVELGISNLNVNRAE
jgi:hypothetical protein